jgi:pilus assembly protein CpaE
MSKSPVNESENEASFGAAPHERPVPRISIDAFCEFPDTTAALERAASDRRLSKAHLGIQPGGIQGAVKYYEEHPTPNLLMVETGGHGSEVVTELEKLASVCDETSKVVVIGRTNDDAALSRTDAPRHLGISRRAAQSAAGHRDGRFRALRQSKRPIGRVAVFAGARGGVGASTIAHNVGWYIAETLKIDTAIIDFDLAFGTAGLNFNEDPGQGIADALAAPERLDDVLLERLLIKCGERLSPFAAPALLDRDYDVDVNAYESVIDQVRRSTPCVIVDLPHAWTPWSRQTLLAADEIVIVSTPDLASLRNTKNMLDVVRARRPNDAPPRLVMNQTGIPKRPEIPVKEFAAAVGMEPNLVLPYDGHLFGTAANNGQMLPELQPQSVIAEGMRALGRNGDRPDLSRVEKGLPLVLAVPVQESGLTNVR